jgi:hypothetical protein
MRVTQVIGSRIPGGAKMIYFRTVKALHEKCEVVPMV